VQIYERSRRTAYNDAVQAACRLPGGHPEGLLEALANVYGDGFDAMVRRASRQSAEGCRTNLDGYDEREDRLKPGLQQEGRQTTYPNVYDGWRACTLFSCVWRATASRALGNRGGQRRSLRPHAVDIGSFNPQPQAQARIGAVPTTRLRLQVNQRGLAALGRNQRGLISESVAQW